MRYLGASNLTAWQLMKSLWVSDAAHCARFDCLPPQYSLICREIEREILPLCRSEGVGVIPWSPLGGGFLTGKYRRGAAPPQDGRLTRMDMWSRLKDERNYAVLEAVEQVARERGRKPSQVALAWVNQQPGVSSVIIGARTLEQTEENLGAIGLSSKQPSSKRSTKRAQSRWSIRSRCRRACRDRDPESGRKDRGADRATGGKIFCCPSNRIVVNFKFVQIDRVLMRKRTLSPFSEPDVVNCRI